MFKYADTTVCSNILAVLNDSCNFLQDNKRFLVKSVAVVNAGLDTVFETIYNLDKRKRYEYVECIASYITYILYI